MTEKLLSMDHGNWHIKALLRKAMIKNLEPRTAIDLFAGKGKMAMNVYNGFNEIHCIEKDLRKFRELEKNMAGMNGINVQLYNMDNLNFIKKIAPGIKEVNLVDFDSYGSPNRQIKTFFDNCKIRTETLIFATDGGKTLCKRGRSFAPGLYLAMEDAAQKASGYDTVIVNGYEKLIRQFWLEMAKAYGFRIHAFKIIWKKGKQVAYYGLLISPK